MHFLLMTSQDFIIVITIRSFVFGDQLCVLLGFQHLHHNYDYYYSHHPHYHQELCVDSGEQLCVLLGFRTTDDNCVDTLEADSERSQVSVIIIITIIIIISIEDNIELSRLNEVMTHD